MIPPKIFDELLYLVYGDQKTISLIQTAQRERAEATLCYDKLNWMLPIPGLHIPVANEIYSGSEYCAALESTIYHNKNYLGCVQGPFIIERRWL
jgi:hypothetical protein